MKQLQGFWVQMEQGCCDLHKLYASSYHKVQNLFIDSITISGVYYFFAYVSIIADEFEDFDDFF